MPIVGVFPLGVQRGLQVGDLVGGGELQLPEPVVDVVELPVLDKLETALPDAVTPGPDPDS